MRLKGCWSLGELRLGREGEDWSSGEYRGAPVSGSIERMRRWMLALAATGIVSATIVPAASAKSRCSVPDEPAWHSCLSALHLKLETGAVRLTRATPTLVIRYDACPAHVAKRTVALRTGAGGKLEKSRVTGRCRKDVARWRTNLRDQIDLPSGTVIRSYWSALPDHKRAPKITLD
jgi:hypothetical protein